MKMHYRVLAMTALVAAGAVPAASTAATSSINIVASDWKFTPDTIQIHVDQESTLQLTSSQGVHGLQSDALGIPLTTIAPGSSTNVKVTPKKAGKYVLHCAIMCGAGHPNMTLTVNVVP
ncbi:MAG: cupredoxin domain-containing protein [Candidatus Cybelea sp.]